jgi:hypothetical protein
VSDEHSNERRDGRRDHPALPATAVAANLQIASLVSLSARCSRGKPAMGEESDETPVVPDAAGSHLASAGK